MTEPGAASWDATNIEASIVRQAPLPGIDVFGLPITLSSQQMQLSDAMVSYWTQFAKKGDPNSSGEPLGLPTVRQPTSSNR